ncbi:MAG TPA: hypothetical protein VK427_11840 [Kofleriaceae bacterium]|nr:hypothetical protein [Kofleriaceae bacterium]
MSDAADRLRQRTIERALHAEGTTSEAERRAAFDNQGVAAAAAPLVDKVAQHAWKVTDEDVATAKRAGLSEDAIFELVVCAALGKSTRQLEAALALLDVEDA